MKKLTVLIVVLLSISTAFAEEKKINTIFNINELFSVEHFLGDYIYKSEKTILMVPGAVIDYQKIFFGRLAVGAQFGIKSYFYPIKSNDTKLNAKLTKTKSFAIILAPVIDYYFPYKNISPFIGTSIGFKGEYNKSNCSSNFSSSENAELAAISSNFFIQLRGGFSIEIWQNLSLIFYYKLSFYYTHLAVNPSGGGTDEVMVYTEKVDGSHGFQLSNNLSLGIQFKY